MRQLHHRHPSDLEPKTTGFPSALCKQIFNIRENVRKSERDCKRGGIRGGVPRRAQEAPRQCDAKQSLPAVICKLCGVFPHTHRRRALSYVHDKTAPPPHLMCIRVLLCVCVCVRARVRACVRACVLVLSMHISCGVGCCYTTHFMKTQTHAHAHAHAHAQITHAQVRAHTQTWSSNESGPSCAARSAPPALNMSSKPNTAHSTRSPALVCSHRTGANVEIAHSFGAKGYGLRQGSQGAGGYELVAAGQ